MKINLTTKICTLCVALFPTYLTAQSEFQSLIPSGWSILDSGQGDLNQDGQPDLALIIEENNPNNIRKDSDDRKINLNPRHLLVFFNNKHRYQLIARNKNLPTADDAESSCSLDPLAESNGIEIRKGLLTIEFSYFMACGGWEWPQHTYTFRYQKQKMHLIGFDYSSFHRSSGEQSASSYNFSTLKVKRTTGGNQFEGGQAKSTWSSFKQKQPLFLNEIKFDHFHTQFEY